MEFLSIPRPGTAPTTLQSPISGPSEDAFTAVFGALLPCAKFLTTPTGKAAYYEIPPSKATETAQNLDRVLFIHGVQTPALGMLPLARALHSSFPHAYFVLVDLWGHGLSDTPVLPHEPTLFHGLIDALLHKLGWASAHLVGFSFGGALTVGYTVSRSSRVKSFTLVAPAGLIPSSSLNPEDKAQLYGADEAIGQKWVLKWLEGGELVVPQDWKESVAKGKVVAEATKEWQIREHPGHMASVLAVVRDGGVFDRDAQFAEAVRTEIPSYVILGELDGVCSEEALKKAGFKQTSVVQGAGHGVVRERIPEVASLIGDFWKRLD